MSRTSVLSSLAFIVISGYTVITGCSPDDNCDKCPPSYSFNNWGDNCEEKCPTECNSGCDRSTGVCDLGCKEGFFDQTCSSTCPAGCNKTCNQTTGYCHKCLEGNFGMTCGKECSNDCKGACKQKTGICAACKPGLTGDFCNQPCAVNKGTQLLSTHHGFIFSAMLSVVWKLLSDAIALDSRTVR